MKIYTKVAIFIILGFFLGLIIPYVPVLHSIFTLIEQVFIKLLTFLVKPYMFFMLVVTFATLKDNFKINTIMPRYLLFTLISALFALIQAVGLSLLIKPGYQIDLFEAKTPSLIEFNNIMDSILTMIPRNFSDVFSGNPYHLIPTFFIAMLLGITIFYAVKRGDVFLNFSKSMEEIFDHINLYAIEIFSFATLFIGYNLATTIKTTSNFIFVIKPFIVMLFCTLIQIFFIPSLLIFFWLKKNPAAYFKSVLGAQLTGFATGSVVTNFPSMIFHNEKNLGIPRHISSLYVSLGTIFNLDGILITSIVGFFYILQIQQISLTFFEILPLLLGMVLLFFVKDGFSYPELSALVLFLTISETLPIDSRALFAVGMFLFTKLSSFITSSSILFINYVISEKYLKCVSIQPSKEQI
ncbi:MAG TPA: cation:dicarboxylase symporter family transporter [Exilispira sp.]|nr:cation:dicarboxylase symporter family transporter [Exilispira sp.]HQQ19655.1 cation:dicarboxylase symporter family transporter [Exilispira sp.]